MQSRDGEYCYAPGRKVAVLRIEVGPDDVAATRFAVSPAFELAMLLRLLVRSAPGAAVRRRFDAGWSAVRNDPGVQALAYLHGPGLGASYAAPPPAGLAQTIDDDLAVIRAAPAEVVAAEVAEVRAARRPSPAVAAELDAPHPAERTAAAVERAWSALLAPEWPRVRAVLERDVRHRADRLTQEGWAGALGGMHPRLAWTGAAIEIARLRVVRAQPLEGRGLLLVPSVFIGEHLAITDESPWRPMLVYPCRGAGLLFEQAASVADPLAPLLGRTRAGLLLALATPSSTTGLAALTGASVGATGDHLRVLLDAGLLERQRAGREVLYRRTALGAALAAS